MMEWRMWIQRIILFTIFLSFCGLSFGGDTVGCVFKSDDVNTIPIEYYGQPVQNLDLQNGTCSRYSDLACCDPFQVSVLDSKLELIEGLYGRCPSCYSNLVDLFCAYICSPYQVTFVENTVVQNTSVLATTFRVDPIYANSVYESCMWVELSGAIVTKDVFSHFGDFFNYFGSYEDLNQQITFDYAFNNSLALLSSPCSETCSCQNCQDVCEHPPNTDAEYFDCKVDFSGAEWDCVTVGLLAGYVGLVIAGFIGIIITFFLRSRDASAAYTDITTSTNTHYASKQFGSSSLSVRRNSPWFSQYWMSHGKFVANHPTMIILLSILLVGGCSFGLMEFDYETDPENLWTTSSARAIKDQDYINDHFGKIFRYEQLIITMKDKDQPITEKQPFLEAFDLQDSIASIQVTVDNETYSLFDVCYQPTGNGCFIESPFEFWQNNRTKILETEDVKIYIDNCTSNALQASCLSSLDIPVNPNNCFGGYSANKDYEHSQALVITFLLNNEDKTEAIAKAWEKQMIELAGQNFQTINVAYSTERSLQDELSSEKHPNIELIAITYSIMLVYLSVSLGYIFPMKGLLVKTKFLLGLAAIAILLGSMVTSIGICSAIGVKATFIASQSLPFIMLAIGLDNLYIILAKYEKLSSVVIADDTRLGQTLAEVGNSTTVAALCQIVAFLFGVVTKMPAIRNLAIYASVTILFNHVLQVTLFCALMVLDGKRVRLHRVDCLPCVKVHNPDSSSQFTKRAMTERKSLVGNAPADEFSNSVIRNFFKNYFTVPLFNPAMKVFVAFMFAGIVFVGVNYSIHMPIGLEQQDVVPKNSYLVDYYDALTDYVTVAPPMYITIKSGFNYTDIQSQNKLCTNAGCNNNSLINQFDGAEYIGGSTYSWLDDYLQWAAIPACCQQQEGVQCVDDFTNCTACFQNLGPGNRPTPQDFNAYLPWFLQSTITQGCKIAGIGYAQDVQLDPEFNGTNGSLVKASRMRLYHSALESQSQYIHAIEVAYNVADESDIDVIPYSGYFVFYEQYLDLQKVAVLDIVISLAAIFIVTLLLRNPWVSLLTVATLSMITVDLIGAMNLFSIELNSVTVVNLVMSIGIGVQFCIHTGYHFSINPLGSKTERAKKALIEVGSPLLCGVTLTKIIGIVAFAFGSATMFEEYFFEVYLSFLVLAALHGFVFFPVLLSFLGIVVSI